MEKAKRTLSFVVAVLMLVTAIPLCDIQVGAAEEYENGDIIEFGSYPQSKVEDEELLQALSVEALTGNWISYGYYSGNGGDFAYGTMVQGDWMKYIDITYGGEKYRGVLFTKYRPIRSIYMSSETNAYQDDNGYIKNNVYWFRYDPIEWIILDVDEGKVISQTILDSQPFNETIYQGSNYTDFFSDGQKTVPANNYEQSTVRQWLNDDFYNTAFSQEEKEEITGAVVSEDSSENIDGDNVYLLSYRESVDMGAYKKSQGSDYAKCQGIYVYDSGESSGIGNSYWILRSSGDGSAYSCYVCPLGNSGTLYCIDFCDYGIRPVMNIGEIIPEEPETESTTEETESESTTKEEPIVTESTTEEETTEPESTTDEDTTEPESTTKEEITESESTTEEETAVTESTTEEEPTEPESTTEEEPTVTESTTEEELTEPESTTEEDITQLTTEPSTEKPVTTKPNITKPDVTKPVPTTEPATTEQNKTQEGKDKVKKPIKIKIKTIKSVKKKRVMITWVFVKSVNGYEVSYSTSKKFLKKVTKKTVAKKAKAKKITLKNLKSGKKYFVKVRAYKTVNGKKHFGAWSKVKTVKVK